MQETNPYESTSSGRTKVNRPQWLRTAIVDIATATCIVTFFATVRLQGWLPLSFTSYLLDVVLPVLPVGVIVVYGVLVVTGRRGVAGAALSAIVLCVGLGALWLYNVLFSIYGE